MMQRLIDSRISTNAIFYRDETPWEKNMGKKYLMLKGRSFPDVKNTVSL